MRGWLAALLLALLATPAAAAPVILVLGDSLSSAYGLPAESGWVALLQKKLRDEGYPHEVVNASVTGETTSGGLSRLPAALARHKPAFVLIELGGNDGLRGLSPHRMGQNLTQMAKLAKKAGAQPVIFEMRIPPNYGKAYAMDFHRTFKEVATAQKAPLVPFFLAPFAADPGHFQDDGIHPNGKAQVVMLDAVWPVLAPVLRPAAANGSG